MRILMIGLGSIGQRHLKNLKKIFPRAVFYAYRKKNKNLVIQDVKIKKKTNLQKYYKLKIINNLKKALKIKPNITFICNPSIFHYRDATLFAKQGSHVFIEKPLYASDTEAKKLIKILDRKKLVSMIGYQLRFHPVIKIVKKIISKKKYGNIISANFNNLTYLPSHHPYEDYSLGYAARKKLGGGAISSLIHEIDLIAFFFGFPTKVYGYKILSKILKLNVDDNVSAILSYNNKNRFKVTLNLSFTHVAEERGFKILFKKSILFVDLIKNKLAVYCNFTGKIIMKKKFQFKRNKLFQDEIKELKSMMITGKHNPLSVKNNFLTNKLYNKLQQLKLE